MKELNVAALNEKLLLDEMLRAAEDVLKAHWPDVKGFVAREFEKLIKTIIQIQLLTASGQISEGEAAVLLDMQKNTARTVMLALKGMELQVVERAIDAAMGKVKDTVNTTLCLDLI